jgi:hypothetical protein
MIIGIDNTICINNFIDVNGRMGPERRFTGTNRSKALKTRTLRNTANTSHNISRPFRRANTEPVQARIAAVNKAVPLEPPIGPQINHKPNKGLQLFDNTGPNFSMMIVVSLNEGVNGVKTTKDITIDQPCKRTMTQDDLKHPTTTTTSANDSLKTSANFPESLMTSVRTQMFQINANSQHDLIIDDNLRLMCSQTNTIKSKTDFFLDPANMFDGSTKNT